MHLMYYSELHIWRAKNITVSQCNVYDQTLVTSVTSSKHSNTIDNVFVQKFQIRELLIPCSPFPEKPQTL